MIILRLAVLVCHATLYIGEKNTTPHRFNQPGSEALLSASQVYSYSQPHVLSRLNVLRALKESMSQMPVRRAVFQPGGIGGEMRFVKSRQLLKCGVFLMS